MELTTVVLQGRAGSTVTYMEGAETGLAYSRFRLVVPKGRRRDSGEWEEFEPRWYTVKSWGTLAKNIQRSINSGEPLVVVGQPRAQAWVDREGNHQCEIAVHAALIGHDLSRGAAQFIRIVPDSQVPDPGESREPSPSVGVVATEEGTLVSPETGEIVGESPLAQE